MPRIRRPRAFMTLPELAEAIATAQTVNELPSTTVDGTKATIRLYDPIDDWGGYWGVSAKEIASVVDALPDEVTEIELLINSPGGFVSEAVAIMNVLRRHEAKVTAIVEGLAASAASFIAASADELVMARNSELMIHEARMITIGTADDHTFGADFLNRHGDMIASIYAARAGGTVADWRARMRVETWFTDQEAVDVGLADRIDEGTTAVSNRIDLSVFKFAGRAAAPAPAASADQADPDDTVEPPASAGDEIADPDGSEVDDWESHDSDDLELLNL